MTSAHGKGAIDTVYDEVEDDSPENNSKDGLSTPFTAILFTTVITTIAVLPQADQLLLNVIGRQRRYGWYWNLGLTLSITFYVVRTFLN